MQQLRRQHSGHHHLLLAGIGCALIYGALLARFPLRGLYLIPLQNLNHLPPAEWPKGLLVLGCIVFLFGGYLLGALVLAEQTTDHRRPTTDHQPPTTDDATAAATAATEGPPYRWRWVVVGFPALFVVLLVLIQPVTSTDLYDYLFRGRMLARYEANPFVVRPNQFPHDPLLEYVAWKHIVTAYGPLWERMSWLTARLAGEIPGAAGRPAELELVRLLFAYKGLAVLGFVLVGAAIWGALKTIAPEQRWLGLYLWLWNPLALWEGVGNGHNDVWMALTIVLAVWAMNAGQGDKVGARYIVPQRGQGDKELQSPLLPVSLSRGVGALLALTFGGLIKFATFFFGPVVLAAAVRRMPSWPARWRLILIGGGVCLAFIAAAYAPFWAGWETIHNVGDRRSMFTATWLAALEARLKLMMPELRAGTIVAWAGLELLLIGVGWAAWRAWRAPGELARHLLWLVLWFLFVCNPWFQPWYVIWPLALVALQPWRKRAVAAVNIFCLTALCGYVVGGLLLPALGLEEKSAAREILISLFLYVPPLVAFGWGRFAWPALRWRDPKTSALPLPRAGFLRVGLGVLEHRSRIPYHEGREGHEGHEG